MRLDLVELFRAVDLVPEIEGNLGMRFSRRRQHPIDVPMKTEALAALAALRAELANGAA